MMKKNQNFWAELNLSKSKKKNNHILMVQIFLNVASLHAEMSYIFFQLYIT
jgi:hypothetical protein